MMDRKDIRFMLSLTLAFVVICVLIFCGAAYFLDRPSCEAKTAEINMESRWSFFGGCQVEVEPDRWIPLDNWYYTENK